MEAEVTGEAGSTRGAAPRSTCLTTQNNVSFHSGALSVNPSHAPPGSRLRSTERLHRIESELRNAQRAPCQRTSLREEREASSRRSSTLIHRWVRPGTFGSNSPPPTRPRFRQCRTARRRLAETSRRKRSDHSRPHHILRTGRVPSRLLFPTNRASSIHLSQHI